MGSEGPRVVAARAVAASGATEVTVDFAGGSAPFYLKGTQYCDACCATGVGDFDASPDDGATWMNATSPHRTVGAKSVSFTVPASRITHVRYTANQAFPQCAVYNQEGLPALPFIMRVSS